MRPGLSWRQFVVWRELFKTDPEAADRVLRRLGGIQIPAEGEALKALLADDAVIPRGYPSREEAVLAQLIALG